MKQLFLVTLAGSMLLLACNNSSNQTTTADSTGTSASPVTGAPATPPATTSADTAKGSDPWKQPMDDMMSQMHSIQKTGDFDIDFANMMAAHHQGAIRMSEVESAQGKDEKMKSKAQEILTKQKEEQQKLQDFVKSYKPSGMKHGEGELDKMMTDAMGKMQNRHMSGDIDKDFATMMVDHHEHGIRMSKMEQQYGMSSQLKQMAKKFIDDQTKDIKEFRDWLKVHK